MDDHERFRVRPGSRVDLGTIDAGFKDEHESHQHALPEIEAYSHHGPLVEPGAPRRG